ncbi:DUF3857 domain-containing protein [Mariniflexile litorale]|uniref:DUF3857 domain-containing protein n=1 Tax=Mariniflexile litorale TaxID=3045158 RepID=A0AAU7EGN7_9FLAO|nr:DUF3857 domain-containing protein [Mariniflexile sp. KMM 9835]MDQ8210263.1 DUF3857 domain-containing protein [Mariniflexile sp. KMM 9835]
MRITTLFLIICFCMNSFAQNFSFGKVSKQELEEKFNPLDSFANAAYLHKYRRTYFQYDQEKGFVVVTEIFERIKIYTQEGFDYTTKKVSLYKSNRDQEEFSNLKAYTYNLIEGKIINEKLGKDGIFESELNKYLNQVKFTMPNIKVGSIIEYKYRVESPFIANIDDFVFQHDIPIHSLEASFEAPEYYNFKLLTKGFLSVIPKVEVRHGKITIMEKERSDGFSGPVKTTFSSSNLDFKKNVTSYSLTNVSALKEEPYVNNINNYCSAISYELSYVKYPQSPIKYYSTTWEDVVKTIFQSPSFDIELGKTGYFEEDIDALINSTSDPIMRASLIYNHVKHRVKWNGYYGKYTDGGVRKAYKDQVGNDAEINLMLTAMLRYAGLNANPVLVSTRHNGIPLFPTLDGYNYVVSAIETSNGVILLDATSKYSTPNILPIRTLNWEGRIVRDDKSSSTISLYPKEKSKNIVTIIANLKQNGNLEGAIRIAKTNYSAMTYREQYLETDKSQYLEKLENEYGGMEIDEFEVKNEMDLSNPVMESFKFTLEGQVDVIADKLYFSPLFFLKTKENPFKLEKREFPVDFGYSSSSRYMISVDLPEGYRVEVIPESVILALPDNLGAFKYNISVIGSKIQLVIDAEMNQAIISPIYYEALKEYFSKMIEKEAEQIVLTKV